MKPSSLPILAAFIAAIGVAGYAIAESAGQGFVPNRLVPEEHDVEPAPAPVTGVLLFDETELAAAFDSGRESCVTAVQVLGIFAREIKVVGGEIQTLSGQLQQDFADLWRQTAGLAPINVSKVFAHVVPRQDGDAIVDVVEIDTEGCALSRTLITGIEWVDLIQAARGARGLMSSAVTGESAHCRWWVRYGKTALQPHIDRRDIRYQGPAAQILVPVAARIDMIVSRAFHSESRP